MTSPIQANTQIAQDAQALEQASLMLHIAIMRHEDPTPFEDRVDTDFLTLTNDAEKDATPSMKPELDSYLKDLSNNIQALESGAKGALNKVDKDVGEINVLFGNPPSN